jgi:hypothetical protein
MGEILPRSLRSVAGAQEKAGHSGRDDSKRKRKTAGVGGRITEAAPGVLAGGAKFEGTCPFVQGILRASEPQVRGITHPSRSRGAEPECQL